MKYRDNMTPEEEAALLAEAHHMELCYAEADAFDAANAPAEDVDSDEYECFDPVRDGWVGKDGRP